MFNMSTKVKLKNVSPTFGNTVLPAVFSSVEEAVSLLKLDKRHKWEEFCGELVYPHKYSYACSGCTETREMQSTPERGSGCHECGYKGRVRNVVPVPAFMPNGSIVKVVPQNGR